MGMCAISGPRVLHDEPEEDELSPRSTTSTTSSSTSGYGSASSRELDVLVETSDHISYSDGALWQRTIPKGRRCKPLSFSGMILYDGDGKQVKLTFEPEAEIEDDEYFSPQPRNLAEREADFRNPRAVE